MLRDMAEYIEREAVLHKMKMDIRPPFAVVRDFPAADVSPVRHGHWMGEVDGYSYGVIVYDVWHCSECDYCIDDGTDDPKLLPKFCPECGAKWTWRNNYAVD